MGKKPNPCRRWSGIRAEEEEGTELQRPLCWSRVRELPHEAICWAELPSCTPGLKSSSLRTQAQSVSSTGNKLPPDILPTSRTSPISTESLRQQVTPPQGCITASPVSDIDSVPSFPTGQQ
ncbi:unnamed protein product [Lepidochelys olivacea]